MGLKSGLVSGIGAWLAPLLSRARVRDYLDFLPHSSPIPLPAPRSARFYARENNGIAWPYWVGDDGQEHDLLAGGGGGGSTDLDGLTDVVISSPATGHILAFDGTSWTNAAASGGGGPIALDSLSDVAVPTPGSGDVLTFDGTSWTSAVPSAGGAANLNDLSDVVITSPATGHVLRYDGSSFLNVQLDHDDLSGLTTGDPHTQYHTNGRGDARYSLLAHDHSGVYATPTDLSSAVDAHAALSNPHPIYLTQAEGDALYAGGGGGGAVATDAIWEEAGDLLVGTGLATGGRIGMGNEGQVLTVRDGEVYWHYVDQWLTFIIDGGGSPIVPGLKGFIALPAGTIASVRLLADQTGSIVVDLWRDAYVSYPPTVADSICSTAKPTISSGIKFTTGFMTGWTTAVADGDILAINVDSCTLITRCSLSIALRKL